MKRFLGWIIAAGVLVVLTLAVVVVFFTLTRRPFPDSSGRVTVPGITAPVEVIRDQRGVPHIYAETSRDLYFAQGYVEAQDRFWQMEFSRRLGTGRLSEYFGETTLGVDRFMRTMNFRDVAQAEYERLTGETRRSLEAYARGVNAYIRSRSPGRLGLEFTLLGLQGVDVRIEDWKPLHTLIWLKIMAYDLGGNLEDEINRIELLRLVGREKTDAFYPDYDFSETPVIVPDAELRESLGEDFLVGSGPRRSAGLGSGSASAGSGSIDGAVAALSGGVVGDGAAFEPLLFGRGGNVGSNSWVIGGSRTETGMPILAADLHLGVQMPSLWYEVVLHADSDPSLGGDPLDVAGFSFPGAPGVILGHNSSIAWGLTNVNPDVQDLYVERINPENPNQYLVNGEWRDMETRVEEITVQGRDEPLRFIVRETRNGPIITDAAGPQDERSSFSVEPPGVPAESLGLTELSLRWTALEPNRTFESVFRLNRARDFEEFREAASYFDIPSQNLVYADTAGNIGYQTPGLIPIRRIGDGTLPVPGWVDEYQWEGYIPFEELPYSFNPEKDYIATANQPVTTDSYPYLISSAYNHGYRARRIVEMIEEGSPNIDLQAVAAQHGDSLNIAAPEILPTLLEVEPREIEIAGEVITPEEIVELQDLLADWNGRMSRDSAGAAAFALVFTALTEETFYDEIPASLRRRPNLLRQTSRLQRFFREAVTDPDNPWWDRVTTPERREGPEEIMLRALARALVEGRDLPGGPPDRWRWGELHTVTFRNQTFGESGIALIEGLFNRGPYEAPSGLDQVYSADFDVTDPYEVVNLSSMRQIVDLGEPGRSRFMHTTGQSGHPFHRHYDDFIEMWRDVEYHPRYWSREDLLAGSYDLLRLDPADGERRTER